MLHVILIYLSFSIFYVFHLSIIFSRTRPTPTFRIRELFNKYEISLPDAQSAIQNYIFWLEHTKIDKFCWVLISALSKRSQQSPDLYLEKPKKFSGLLIKETPDISEVNRSGMLFRSPKMVQRGIIMTIYCATGFSYSRFPNFGASHLQCFDMVQNLNFILLNIISFCTISIEYFMIQLGGVVNCCSLSNNFEFFLKLLMRENFLPGRINLCELYMKAVKYVVGKSIPQFQNLFVHFVNMV